MDPRQPAPRIDNPYSHLSSRQAGGSHMSINPLNLAGYEQSFVESASPYGDTIVQRELPGVIITPEPQQQVMELGRNQPGNPALGLHNPAIGDDVRSRTSLPVGHGKQSALPAPRKPKGTNMRAVGRFRGTDDPPAARFL